MKKNKAKVSPPIDLKSLGEEVLAFCQNGATKEDVSYFIKEFEEMKVLLEEGKRKLSLNKSNDNEN